MSTRSALILALLFSSDLIWTAPAPTRGHAPDVRAGRYLMGWAGKPYVVVLSESGDYYARATSNSEDVWVGTWKWERQTRTLTVSEKQPHAERYRPAWRVKLNHDLHGLVDNGNGYSVTRVDLGRTSE